MSVTDGFNSADSIGQMPGNVLIGEKSCGGVTAKVYMQECQGLAESGQHGWFHVGIDLVVDATGEILDSLPMSVDSDPAHEGHYKGEEAARACAAARLAEYQEAFDKGTAAYEAEGRKPDLEAWAEGFRAIRRTRQEMDAFYQIVAAMMFGGDDDDDENSSGDMLMSLLASSLGIAPLNDSEEKEVAALLGDFDPDKVEPTDEGYGE